MFTNPYPRQINQSLTNPNMGRPKDYTASSRYNESSQIYFEDDYYSSEGSIELQSQSNISKYSRKLKKRSMAR